MVGADEEILMVDPVVVTQLLSHESVSCSSYENC